MPHETRTDAQPLAATPPQRVAWIDRMRGGLLLAMISYHAAFDLSLFGLVGWSVAEGPWRAYAIAIASGFVALSGLSLALAYGDGIRWAPFGRRLGRLALAAAAVTAASWAAMPYPILFGILHAIALFSVIAVPFLGAPAAVILGTAGIVLFLPHVATSGIFAHPILYPLGLDPAPPPSLDYEPVFPWFAAMLVGIWAARHVPVPQRRAAMDPLARMGRHSLLVYLIHQPILIGALALARWTGLI